MQILYGVLSGEERLTGKLQILYGVLSGEERLTGKPRMYFKEVYKVSLKQYKSMKMNRRISFRSKPTDNKNKECKAIFESELLLKETEEKRNDDMKNKNKK
jgi:hypothetical protein